MGLPTISPSEARTLIERGAVLIDIRGTDEHRREHIGSSQNRPLDVLGKLDSAGAPIIFHCRAGSRTTANADTLAATAPCEAYILEGGIEAWKRAGLPVIVDRAQPIEVMRQVQIAAGGLVVAGVLLGHFVQPGFTLIALVMGVGLVFAGVTGWCGLAKLLGLMPWNKRTAP